MKAVIIAAMLLSSAGSCNAQTIPTTPNLGLQLIPDGYQNWGVPYRTTMNTIDSKVAPLASPHFTGTATAVNLTVTGTCTGCGSGSGAVDSVFGRTGTISAQSGDYNFSQVSGQMNFATQGTGLVPIANGGTGTSSPGLVQGTNITITGTWPNQTINATASAQVYPAAGVAVSTGSAWGSSLTSPSGALVGTTDTQTLTNKTVDGVTPTTMGYVDPTSSIQTQLNAKAPLASPTLTGVPTAPTATVGTNTTQLATTAFVLANGSSYTLPQATTSVLGGVKPDGTTCTTTAGVLTCAGSGGISGLTAGYIPLATSSTAIGNSLLNYGVTTASTFTFGAAVTINDASGKGGGFDGTEGTAATGASGVDNLWADSTAHRLKMNNNNGGATNIPGVATAGTSGHLAVFASNGIDLADGGAVPSGGIANTTVTLPTTAIAANTCTSPATATMTGLATTSTFTTAFATNPNAVTGWGSSGGLTFTAWPTANTLNWSVCNSTASSITPGAMVLNVGAR